MSEQHMNGVRTQLSNVASMQRHTHLTENRILTATKERLVVVDELILKLRARAELDTSVAKRYQDLIAERGKLRSILG